MSIDERLAEQEELTREQLAAAYAEDYAEGLHAGRIEGYAEGYALARAEAYSEGLKLGAKAVHERAKAILFSEAAKGRDELAYYFALETEMPAEQVIAVLLKMPPSAAAAESGLLAEMRAITAPNIGTGFVGAEAAQMSQFEKGAAAARGLPGKNRGG